MDTKIEIKEEDLLSDDIMSQSQREIFPNYLTINVKSDNILLGDHCDAVTKTEVKSETPFIDCSLKQFKSEAITVSNKFEIDMKTELEQLILDAGPDERDFLSDDTLMNVKKYNSDHEVDNKLEIREEQCWLETETSYACDDSKVGEFSPIKSSRLCMEGDPGDIHVQSPLSSAEVSERVKSFFNENGNLEQSGECRDGEINNRSLYSRLKNISHKGKKSLKCSICGKNFRYKSELKQHEFVHGGERPHVCKTCDKSFTKLSNLRAHILIHEGKRPHQCNICNKSFSQSSKLKRHTLIHQGIKPHKCEMCDKSFTLLQTLIIHQLTHEGKKSYKCKICDKSFTHSTTLKSHTLVHEGKRPYTCEQCDKSFTQLHHLKSHTLVHVGKKPYKCEICDKRFTRLFSLKNHILIHEGKTPYKCEVCCKSFTRLSYLKRHNLTHERRKLV